MSNGINSATMIGNLTNTPELRYTAQAQAVCNFSVAVNEKYKSGDEWKESVFYIDVQAWGNLGENCNKYLSKGREVYVEGRLATRTWESDGRKHYKTELVARRVKFLGGGQGQSDSGVEPEPF